MWMTYPDGRGDGGPLPLYSSYPSPTCKGKVGWREVIGTVEPGRRGQGRVRDGLSTLKPPITS